jgi:UDP-N-acetylmuramate-alanine ligase
MAHPDARYIGPRQAAVDFLAAHAGPPAVVITLGAGNGDQIGEWLLARRPKSSDGG